jgi:hypothetical protein
MKKYIVSILATLVFTGLSSCLTEEPPFTDNGNFGIVELDLAARTTSTPYAVRDIERAAGASVDIPVIVNYTGVNGAPADVQVTLELHNGAVTTYASATSTNLTILPDGSYELPASNTVVIPKGEKKATYTIKVSGTHLSDALNYGLGVRIAGASGGIISGNYSTGVYRLIH